MTVWTHALLDELRQIGDPDIDLDGERPFTDIPRAGSAAAYTDQLVTWRASVTGAFPAAEDPGFADASRDKFWDDLGSRAIDPKQLVTAYSLFGAFGGEIGATLLMASLPNAYAAEAGAGVLSCTHELQSHTRRRIGETAQFVVEVLFPDHKENRIYRKSDDDLPADDALPIGTRAYVRVRTTRLTHAIIRSVVGGQRAPTDRAGVPAFPDVQIGVPINQEDLLGTLGTFTVTVFDVMEKLGIPWTDEAESAYLALWDRVGELLGIGSPAVVAALSDGTQKTLPAVYKKGLRPQTADEARVLTELIRLRNWPIPLPGTEQGPFANPNGKLLIRALLDELQSAMPRGMDRAPLLVMRYLVDPRARELLGLGGGGMIDTLMNFPRQPRLTCGTGLSFGRGMGEGAMRLVASDISRRAFVHLISVSEVTPGASKFWFPVVDTPTVLQGREPVPPPAPPTEPPVEEPVA